eukprot:CAMPEP_0195595418 /NCGR_PEP_ID=MMETSP0815-20121206/1927_1 /TAXON_ID=97485 /ORGANISM="Prymnesium parvum, Strain Texoma1" /LENGTH=190 /DNA_ID=CAMNT_0040734663 /DNA_START=30 /DNA_END=603 /DNA_ORIENTATION=-
MARGPSIDYAKHDTVLSIERLDDTCASAKVQIVLPASPTSLTPTFEPTCYTDWLTLLHDTAIGGWRVISKVYSGTPFEEHKGSARVLASVPVEPGAFHDLASAVWDVYVGSGRACDGVTMAMIFHPCSKLTFINDNGSRARSAATTSALTFLGGGRRRSIWHGVTFRMTRAQALRTLSYPSTLPAQMWRE